MQHYDIIIAGGGAAGLSLAYRIIHSPLRDRTILIVDKGQKNQNDRTWGFWTNQPTPFDELVYRSWSQVQLCGDDYDSTIDLQDYRYQMIRGIDFYQFVRQDLSAYPNVTFLQGVVHQIEDGADSALVSVGDQMYSADWVFDSTFKPAMLKYASEQYQYLKLHFKGWEISTTEPVFNPDAVTLMDFRTPQEHETRFFYVLPFSEQRALVEYTAFAPTCGSRQEYEQLLTNYLRDTLGLRDFQILSEENGVIPATDYPFPRRIGRRVMSIGTRAGQVKPTTGYAFMRIQEDSEAIVQSLLTTGQPFHTRSAPRRYRHLDSIMLRVMQDHGDQLPSTFAALFKRNPIRRVLRFLDETASVWENLLLVASLPPWLFLRTAWQMKVAPFLDMNFSAPFFHHNML